MTTTEQDACKHCSKPIEPCEVRRSHVGCASAYGYIHRNGGHACEPRSNGPYAQPIAQETGGMPQCGHGPAERCFDCATDDEMLAAIPDFPSTGEPTP